MTTVYCESWREFRERIVTDQFQDGWFNKGRYLFRGQGSDTWKLQTSFDRWYASNDKAGKNAAADRLMEEFEAGGGIRRDARRAPIKPDGDARAGAAPRAAHAIARLEREAPMWQRSSPIVAWRRGLTLEKYVAVGCWTRATWPGTASSAARW